MAPMPKRSTVPAAQARPVERIQAAHDALPAAQRRLTARLAKTDEAVRRAEQARVETVIACREANISWDVIALILGVAQPNATAKYLPYLRGDREVRVFNA